MADCDPESPGPERVGSITSASLLEGLRDRRNAAAWQRSNDRYRPLVLAFARKLGLDDSDAQDAAQETMMAFVTNYQRGGYDPAKGRFRKWLYGVSRRQALSRLRDRHRRTRAQWVPGENGHQLVDQLEDRSDENASDLWQQEWRYALLDEALNHVQGQVGEKAYEAFTRYAVQRQPVDEVANTLDIAPSSVYVYKHRVLAAIRSWVEQFEDD